MAASFWSDGNLTLKVSWECRLSSITSFFHICFGLFVIVSGYLDKNLSMLLVNFASSREPMVNLSLDKTKLLLCDKQLKANFLDNKAPLVDVRSAGDGVRRGRDVLPEPR
jgi:hypothetical protein